MSDPPATAIDGGSFSVTDKVLNQGNLPAGPSVTRYYLSVDTLRNSGDKALTGTRAVPGLDPLATSADTVSVTIPAGVAPGAYFLLACADDTHVVPEGNEKNNCTASAGTVVVSAPDLVETAVSDPPVTAIDGGSFSVTDTVLNQGNALAGPSTTRYYLSLDTLRNSGDKALTGTRAVAGLAPLATSTDTVSVTIPAGVAPGTYFLLACADDTRTVPEGDEKNNCTASAGTVVVSAPDLVESAVSDPPATAVVGGSFSVTDTVLNQGTAAAGLSTTRYYLSIDALRNSGDRALTGTRPVPGLAPLATSTDTISVRIPASVTPGTYFLLACADDTRTVPEGNESNNCIGSTATVVVGP